MSKSHQIGRPVLTYVGPLGPSYYEELEVRFSAGGKMHWDEFQQLVVSVGVEYINQAWLKKYTKFVAPEDLVIATGTIFADAIEDLLLVDAEARLGNIEADDIVWEGEEGGARVVKK